MVDEIKNDACQTFASLLDRLESTRSSFRTIMGTFYVAKAILSEHPRPRFFGSAPKAAGMSVAQRNYLRNVKYSRGKIIGPSVRSIFA